MHATQPISTRPSSSRPSSTRSSGTQSSGPDTGRARYLAPDPLSRRVLNPLMVSLIRLGVGARGGRILHVRGRRTGEWRRVPVNPLIVDGRRYLVAPRGTTEWVRNLRCHGSGRLQLGRRLEDFTATEVPDVDKAGIIRAYLTRWSAETSRFFEGLDASSTDGEIAELASGFPVFLVTAARH